MPRNRSCGSYGPGHLMHWIQGKKSHEDGQPIIKVKVVAVHDDGHVEIEGDDLKLTLWYHDPERLRDVVDYAGRDRGVWKRPAIAPAHQSLRVLEHLGQEVLEIRLALLLDGASPMGDHELAWNSEPGMLLDLPR